MTILYLRLVIVAFVCALCASCASTSSQLTGANEYIITMPLEKRSAPIPPSGSVKVYLSADDWQLPSRLSRSVRGLEKDYGFTIIDTWPLDSIDEFCVVIRTDDPTAVERIRQDPRVAGIQPINYFVTMKTHPPYNDEKLEAQLGQDVASLNRLHEWSTGKDVRVGIIDTAIDVGHPDLEKRIYRQDIFVAETLDANDLIHGTAVAGIISAEAGNGIGVVGYAPDVKLHSYAACYHRDAWNQTVCNTFSLAKALAAAADDGIQVLNMSLAGPRDLLLSRLIDALMEDGTIIVASDSPEDGARRFPASMARVIAASRLDDTRETAPPLIKVDDEHLTTRTGGTYQFFYGSSMSAARVTALVSLLLERDPDIGELETRQYLANVIENCHTPLDGEAACAMKFALTDKERLAVTMVQSQ